MSSRRASRFSTTSSRSPTSTTPTELVDFVEAPARFTSVGPDVARSISAEVTLLAAEGYCAVQAVRFGADVPERLAEVRAFMRVHDVRIGSWWLCERSTPGEGEAQPLRAGLVQVRGDYEIAGMLLTREPPAGPSRVEARRVRTADEYAA